MHWALVSDAPPGTDITSDLVVSWCKAFLETWWAQHYDNRGHESIGPSIVVRHWKSVGCACSARSICWDHKCIDKHLARRMLFYASVWLLALQCS